jgi:hypothetical protein
MHSGEIALTPDLDRQREGPQLLVPATMAFADEPMRNATRLFAIPTPRIAVVAAIGPVRDGEHSAGIALLRRNHLDTARQSPSYLEHPPVKCRRVGDVSSGGVIPAFSTSLVSLPTVTIRSLIALPLRECGDMPPKTSTTSAAPIARHQVHHQDGLPVRPTRPSRRSAHPGWP